MEREYYPLTHDQKGLFSLIGVLPIEALNMSVRVNITSEINEEKALEAMRLTIKNLVYCRMRLHRQPDGEAYLYIDEDEPVGIECIDLSKYSTGKFDSHLEKLAREPFDNKGFDSPLYRLKLFKAPDGKYVLYCTLLHIIADAYSLMWTICYFDKVYHALFTGEAVPDSKCTTMKLLETSNKCYSNTEKMKIHNAFFEEMFATEPHFTSINGLGSHEFIKGKNYGKNQNLTQFSVGSMPMRVPYELVSKVNEAALGKNISPQIYYLLALRTYLGKVSGTEDVMLATTAARRATLVQKNGGMSIAHLIYNRSIISGSVSVEEGLKQLNTVQNDTYRHADVDILPLEAAAKQKLGCPDNCQYKSVVLTYQPYFPSGDVSIDFTAQYLNTGLAVYPLYINLMPMDNSGDLWAEYLYAKHYTKPESIERFHAFLLKFLDTIATDPSRTIDEIAEECL